MTRRFEPLQSSKLFSRDPKVYAANKSGIRFPLLGSYKYDGWRLFEYAGKPHTRSLSLPRNRHTQEKLAEFYKVMKDEFGLLGLDGEAVAGPVNAMNAMQNSTSAFSSGDGQPEFTYLIFDSYQYSNRPYQERFQRVLDCLTPNILSLFPWVKPVVQVTLYDWEQVEAFLEEALKLGYEGIMLRSPDAIYKMGRSTLKDGGILTALKPFVDGECIIEEVIEQMHNANPAEVDNYGRMKRSSHQANLVGKGTMGSVRCRDPKFDEPFNIGYGKGLNDALRRWLWEHRDEVTGASLCYEYQEVGCKDRPRHPRWRSLRAKEDLPRE